MKAHNTNLNVIEFCIILLFFSILKLGWISLWPLSLVSRSIMPQPEWWRTRRWPPRTLTEKALQLCHTVIHFVLNLQQSLPFVQIFLIHNDTLRVECSQALNILYLQETVKKVADIPLDWCLERWIILNMCKTSSSIIKCISFLELTWNLYFAEQNYV